MQACRHTRHFVRDNRSRCLGAFTIPQSRRYANNGGSSLSRPFVLTQTAHHLLDQPTSLTSTATHINPYSNLVASTLCTPICALTVLVNYAFYLLIYTSN
ncbi:hypothetical protein HBI26_069820 [Parastagonospora nodorum]|nr:hypothetical protein HBI06_132480 [Parastagonospora nodorum]KAH4233749.1 hypothetical protein HBI05_162450 [Parastagonospora nodorum]KAH4604071.1 hypothetical protein HBH82_142400 [Parastagonospora nodorum]KAH4701176.1 hypothetical protein HBH78_062690 [Parastagonospora nodorum]KAH4703251.1 hypothetical protein HBH67_116570 [Parastagonospora nodorum]